MECKPWVLNFNLNIMRKPKTSAFTLVELMMVLTLMAIMLGAIVPSFNHVLGRKTLKNAADALSNMIRYTRSVAVTRSVMSKMLIDTELNTYTLYVETDPINSTGDFEQESYPVSFTKELGSPIQVQKMDARALNGSQFPDEILFNPDGSTSDALIYLTDPSEKIYTIGVLGITGQVMVWDHFVESFYES